LLVGQSYRAQPNLFLPVGSGAEKRLSSMVGRLTLSPSSYLDLVYRFRYSTNPWSSQFQQIGLAIGPPALRLAANFVYLPA